jgi:hypothetical protein
MLGCDASQIYKEIRKKSRLPLAQISLRSVSTRLGLAHGIPPIFKPLETRDNNKIRWRSGTQGNLASQIWLRTFADSAASSSLAADDSSCIRTHPVTIGVCFVPVGATTLTRLLPSGKPQISKIFKIFKAVSPVKWFGYLGRTERRKERAKVPCSKINTTSNRYPNNP